MEEEGEKKEGGRKEVSYHPSIIGYNIIGKFQMSYAKGD